MFEHIATDKEALISVFWHRKVVFPHVLGRDRLQVCYGYSKWPSHSIFCIWLPEFWLEEEGS